MCNVVHILFMPKDPYSSQYPPLTSLEYVLQNFGNCHKLVHVVMGVYPTWLSYRQVDVIGLLKSYFTITSYDRVYKTTNHNNPLHVYRTTNHNPLMIFIIISATHVRITITNASAVKLTMLPCQSQKGKDEL